MTTTASRAPTILLVDDDELIISSLRGLFTLETDYDLITKTDPKEALEEVSRTPIDIVITDFLMPQMNGVEFLKQVMALQPDAVRILLTGFADKENAIRAINQVGLYRYLEKPWDNEDLLLLVHNALQQKSLRWQLTEKVSELDRLVRQHVELTDRHRLLERELEMAARVQRSLLPSELPKVDGLCFSCHYQPSTKLGGDYYDFVRQKDSTIVLVSDVSGHGAQASLVSMLIKATFQDVAKYAEGPSLLLAEMNTRLHRFLPTGMYAGATVVWVPAGSATIRITNAGLPHPFILRASGRVDQIPLNGLPLGMFGESMPDAYDSQERDLGAGDVLLVSTDGLGEIRRQGSDEFFQDRQLLLALQELTGKPGDAVIEALLRKALEFSAEEPWNDDLSMIAMTKT
jgi:serine phosphatase RsbU (regulator of sigma subunit)